MSRCLSCDAEVVFVKSRKSGRPMILDAKPAKGVVLWDSMEDDFVRSLDDVDGKDEGRVFGIVATIYTDHHATCPDAAAWKGRRRGGVRNASTSSSSGRDGSRDDGSGVGRDAKALLSAGNEVDDGSGFATSDEAPKPEPRSHEGGHDEAMGRSARRESAP